MCKLKIFITGRSSITERDIGNVRSIFEEEFSHEYTLEIIDIIENPHIAESEKILATPTLVKSIPGPERRIIGDFCKKQSVLRGLGLMGAPED